MPVQYVILQIGSNVQTKIIHAFLWQKFESWYNPLAISHFPFPALKFSYYVVNELMHTVLLDLH